jgi:ferredoxin-NADP reductase
MAQKFTAEVVQKDKISANVYFVTFKLLEPNVISFRAGQCMMIMCGTGVNRTMSICSVPTETNQVSMVADVSPMGPGSKWTIGLSVGDKVNFVAPTGVFFFDDASPRKKVFVATGTGIAPFYSMIKDYLNRKGDAQLELYWGLRYEADIFWQEAFNELFETYPNFRWHQILSKPPEGWKGLTGHVTEHVLQIDKDLPMDEYYLCGNRSMIDDVRAQLLAKNVPKDQIKSELFY